MANESIIKAAGQAYAPNPGQYDLSGFIQGITAVAAGVVKQGQIRKKMQSDLNKFYFPSANPQVQAVAEVIKAKVMDPKENFSVQEGINALKTLEYQIKTVLPKINTKFGDIDKKGLAGSVEPFAENYVNNIATGQLDQTIKIGNETASAVYRVNPQTLGLEMMGIDGGFVTPELLYANLGNLPTLDTASKPTTKMIGYVDDKFAKGEKGSWKETSDGITNYFNNQIVPNKKVFLAFLSDNMDGFTITNKKNITEEISWYDHYMDQTMDENQKAIVQPVLDGITDPEVLKRTKQIYMNELMKGDKNLKKDFNSYLEKIKLAKDPGDIVETPAYVLGSEFNPSVNNPADFKLGRFSRAMFHMLKYDMSKKKYTGTFYKKADGDILATLTDYKVVFRKVANNDENGKKLPSRIQMYRQDGKENNVAIGNPFEASQEGVAKAMPSIKSALSMTESKAELTSAENYRLFLKNENNWDYLTRGSNIYGEKRNYTNL